MTPTRQKQIEDAANNEWLSPEIQPAEPVGITTFTELFIAGAQFADANPSAEVLALVEALKFECGNRCAHQNPCNAKEAIEAWDKRGVRHDCKI